MKALPKVAIIGRPNVGKSTLFNRLVGKRVAITDSIPGVTRDRLFARLEWGGHAFELIDTAGILAEVLEQFDTEIQYQVEAAIRQADLLLFTVDATEGPTADEEDLVERMRRTGKPVILVVNKIDSRGTQPLEEFHRWGFARMIGVSAMVGTRTGDLLDLVIEALPEAPEFGEDLPADAIKVAVIGKPNVGKSSLVNSLTGEERMVVSTVAGTTRDPVDTLIRYYGRPLVLIDTAGLRKSMKTASGLEFYTLLRTAISIDRCDVAILMLDSTERIARQDMRIAEMAMEKGKSMILAMNKWDLVENKTTMTAPQFEKDFKADYPNLAFLPMLFISAHTNQRLGRLLQFVVEVFEQRGRKISDEEAGEFLRQAVTELHPPASSGKFIKLLSCHQVATAPPVLEIMANDPDRVAESYRRYLLRRFRERFPFTGTPVRLRFSQRQVKQRRKR